MHESVCPLSALSDPPCAPPHLTTDQRVGVSSWVLSERSVLPSGPWAASRLCSHGGEGRGAHGFKKVSGVLGSGFVNTEEEEVVWVFFFVLFFQGTTNT